MKTGSQGAVATLLFSLPVAVAASLFGVPARALTMEEFLSMPDEIRFPYVLGLADGIVAGQPDIATRNFLSRCISEFGMRELHDSMRRQVQSDPALTAMDTGIVAGLVIAGHCDSL